jgi:alpha-ketoglutarate-dependent taurine dioxygenase
MDKINNLNTAPSPFALNEESLYQQWREKKLQDYPKNLTEIMVEIDDPRQLKDREHQAILNICQKTNMALYCGKTGTDDDHFIPIRLGQQFGMLHLDHNWLSDDDGLTSLTVAKSGTKQHFIPYSNKLIQWHTDGYYNKPHMQIHSLLLHCVQSAASGGENRLLDHEIAYLILRDKNPAYIKALMKPDVMTIPARMKNNKVARQEETGPVFSIAPTSGDLHMRYTMRNHNIIWKNDALTQQAVMALTELLNSDSPYIFRGRLEPGMGLICNNILHDRSHFIDDENHKRLLYRARFYQRMRDTGVHQK